MKSVFNKIYATVAAIAAGVGKVTAAGLPPATDDLTNPGGRTNSLSDQIRPLFDREVPRFFAAHRSHSSHGSHASHRSSSGGSYSAPRPAPAPVIPPKRSDPLGQRAKPPSTFIPPIKDVPQLQNNPEKRAQVIRRLQLTLTLLNVYAGPVDGVMSSATRDAIDLYKIKKGVRRGGYLDAETLNLFGVTID